jgi:hypothetical protein
MRTIPSRRRGRECQLDLAAPLGDGIAVHVPAMLLWEIFSNNTMYEFIRGQCHQRALSQTAVQSLGVVLGIFLGRPIARTLVRMLIPPKPRQALTFLWTIDGKTPSINSGIATRQ